MQKKTTTSFFAFLMFFGFSVVALAQTGVRGTITDAAGIPLFNASVLVEGQGKGATLESANGTAWGLLHAVTEYVDHERRARSNEYRMDSAWFGQGAQIKQRALDTALQLVA